MLLNNLEVEKAARIAAFYDFSREELEFLAGDRAEEIEEYVRKHDLHRIEDESFLGLSGEEDASKRLEVKEEKKKKVKDLTLDSFFT